MRPLLAFRRLLIPFVILSLVLLGGGIGWALGNNAILSSMLMGSFLIHMATRPDRAEWLAVLVLAALFRFGYPAFFEFQPYFGSSVIRWGSFLGLASLLIQLILTVRARGEARQARAVTFLTAGALPYSWVLLAFCLSFVTRTSTTYDAYLLAFDSSLGAPVSFIFGRFLAEHPLLQHLTKRVYDALPLGASCILAWNNRSRFRPVNVIPMYITMMVLGYGLYWLYPAAGPAFAYRGLFPQIAPAKWEILSMTLAPFEAPRNAMPSLHFGAMLLLMWNSRTWPAAGRVAAGAFSCGIAFATLGLGEHYLIDLVVAFPFMLAMQSLWTSSVPLGSPSRYQPIAAGALATAAWFAALRWAVPAFLSSSPLAWFCVLTTVGGTIWLERRLARLAWGTRRAEVPATSESFRRTASSAA
jgi:PAP2 superfamily